LVDWSLVITSTSSSWTARLTAPVSTTHTSVDENAYIPLI
jgi:hypothetical protein